MAIALQWGYTIPLRTYVLREYPTYFTYLLTYRLLSEVDDTHANASTGCDDRDFVDVIFADLVAVQALPLEVRQAYR